MTTVTVGYGIPDPTHDLALQDGTDAQVAAGTATKLGLIFAGGPRVLQEIPLSPPAQAFEIEQRNWIGGRGRVRYDDDPTGFFDSSSLWTTTDGKVMPMLQWRFCKGLRSADDSSLPGAAAHHAHWKLYGNDPTNKIARYLTIPFVAGASYNADKGYLLIRRRGTPVDNLLTFELCADGTSKPGSVLKTVTKTITDITDTISLFTLFDWTGTQALVSGTTYYIKIYGGANDTSANHWEILCSTDSTNSKYSTDNTNWTTSTVSMYYRITDADTNRQWKFFTLEGGLYAVSINDDGTTSLIRRNGIRGTATSATSTTLTDTNVGTMVTDRHAGALIRIIDGTGDGQARLIASNTATQFTVTTAWDITPDTTSRYVVYASDYMPSIGGAPGIGAVKNKPLVVGAVAYFPQGQSVTIRKMRVNASSHDFADDGTNKADLMGLNVEGTAPLVYAANVATATLQAASVVGWPTNLTLGTAKQIGGSEFRITNLFSHNKVMKVFKEDGPYTYNNGIVERDGGNFADIPDPTTGLGVGTQNGQLWWGWAHSLERQTGSSVDDMLNFKRGYDGIPLDRVGYISCIVSAVGWLFFVIDGGTSNYSSIVGWNGMGFHEIFRGWAAGVRIRNAMWQGCPETRNRLWFDVGGDMAFIEFPRAANPLKGTAINYQHEGVLITSTYDAHDQNLYKILGLLRVFLESGSVEIDYQTNANVGTNNWTVLGTISTQPVSDITLDMGSVFQIRFRFRSQVTASQSPTVLTGWQISGRMMPLDKYQFLGTFKTDSDQTTFTDEPDHDPNTLYTQLKTWAQTQTVLTMRTQGQSSDEVSVTVSLPSKSVDWIDSGESKWGGRISFAILQT